jgi:hypothetical protein
MVDPSIANDNPNLTDPTAASYTRTHRWSIDKSVKKVANRTSSGKLDLDYTVSVVQTGFGDSGWRLTGEIDLVNPNPTDLTDVTVTDSVDNGGNCAVVNGSRITLPGGGRTTALAYSCTWTSAPAPASGADTAVATWDGTLNRTADSSIRSQTAFAFGGPTTTAYSRVTISDSYAGILGELTATDSTPYASRSFTYTRTQSHPRQHACSTPTLRRS